MLSHELAAHLKRTPDLNLAKHYAFVHISGQRLGILFPSLVGGVPFGITLDFETQTFSASRAYTTDLAERETAMSLPIYLTAGKLKVSESGSIAHVAEDGSVTDFDESDERALIKGLLVHIYFWYAEPNYRRVD